jgi:hypothetical protein
MRQVYSIADADACRHGILQQLGHHCHVFQSGRKTQAEIYRRRFIIRTSQLGHSALRLSSVIRNSQNLC